LPYRCSLRITGSIWKVFSVARPQDAAGVDWTVLWRVGGVKVGRSPAQRNLDAVGAPHTLAVVADAAC
jgi:hypothetical protein